MTQADLEIAAQIYYARALDLIPTSNRYGLINSAPYLCCTFSCLLTYHVNKFLGRRGTIFVTCLISSVACFGQAFVQSWQALFAARFALGFGIGIKSATIPSMYAIGCQLVGKYTDPIRRFQFTQLNALPPM